MNVAESLRVIDDISHWPLKQLRSTAEQAPVYRNDIFWGKMYRHYFPEDKETCATTPQEGYYIAFIERYNWLIETIKTKTGVLKSIIISSGLQQDEDFF